MLNLVSTLNIGFSLVIAAVLFICFLFFLKGENKTPLTLTSCGLFLACSAALQVEHLTFMQFGAEPLDTLYYRALLFLAPPLFYFFCRFLLFSDYRFKTYSVSHFLPFCFVWFLPREIAVPFAFVLGAGYCLWMSHVIYSLKSHRRRFEVEFFFLVVFSVFAIAVLMFGFSATYVDSAYFYHFYANGIALAYMLVTAALVIYPDLLNEITDVVSMSYSKSTLTNINVDKQVKRLEELMQQSRLYQNENLNLSRLAEAMELSSHQLSELINTRFGMNFSQYLRDIRIKEAKELLKNEPDASILSISMETGFKSQSNFYAAFKDITGMSPGAFRKSVD
ncbi:AraC family transcriptional regulator [Pleionea sediminis]|uniref:AraC family transcriptional regulator n=1 Tax=Pleionea sediminis TaxID=2569479 RepID=UPI001185821F|nr:helix-turn-helix domain-containing protein [Pleionea sediminis]